MRSTVTAKLAQANAALAEQINRVAGELHRHDRPRRRARRPRASTFHLFGIQKTKALLDQVLARLADPGDAPGPHAGRELHDARRGELHPLQGRARLARPPVAVQDTMLSGRRAPLDTFAVAVAVTVSLMFVCVLLASGLIALEREENTFARLTRPRPPRPAARRARSAWPPPGRSPVTLGMLMGISAFVPLDWGRAWLWALALAAAALGFATLGVAIGSLAREVRAASLLAFLLSLPLAFLALVPSGAVSPTLYHVIQAISAAFPFKPALDATNAAINQTTPSLGVSIAHLAGLAAVFGLAARVGLGRSR